MIETSRLKKIIKIYSWVFIIFAAIDVCFIVLSYLEANGAEAQAAGLAGTELAMAVVIIYAVMYGIDIIGKLFFAYKGFKEVKGENKGTGYVTFIYVLVVLTIIGLVASVIQGMMGTETNWGVIFEQVASASILFDFARKAKELHGREDK